MRIVSENRVFEYQGVGNAVMHSAVCVRNITDYSPFGVSLDGRTIAYQPAPAPTPAVGVIYLHKFDDGATTHPYTTAPDAIDPNLSNGVWTNNTNYWYNYTSYTGKAIAINRADYDTARLYLNFTVASGKNMDVKSFSFYHRSSSTGYSNYKLYVNNILVGSGTIYVTSNSNFQFTGTQNVLNAISGLTGNVTVRLDLFGGLHGIAATFRLDNFTLNGYTQLIGSPNLLAKGYRYGFDGMELDDEIKGGGNSYSTEFRQYDPRLGRWLSLDPLSPKYPAYSSFNFTANNPILFVDKDGQDIHIFYDTGEKNADGTAIYSSYKYGSGLNKPNDKFVRRTVRTLNRIERRGLDPKGIINQAKNSESNYGIFEASHWYKTGGAFSIQVGEVTQIDGPSDYKPAENEIDFIISWHTRSGYISVDGKTRQSAGNALLHELAHKYYIDFDPEGHVAEKETAFAIEDEALQNAAIEAYYQKEAVTVGDYNTYSDKWIIQNVEPSFKEGVRQNHNSGYFLHTIGSTFSRFGLEYGKLGRGGTPGVSGKVRDLPRPTENSSGGFEQPASNSECDDRM